MKYQDWIPYFSGQSSTLEALWKTTLDQSPWLTVTPEGIAIDWNTARAMNPDSFPESSDLDRLETLQILVAFIPWDTLRPDRLNLKNQSKSACVPLGQMPINQNHGVLWEPVIDKTRQFIEELKDKLKSNEKHFRHKKFNGFFLLDDYELHLQELWNFPQLEYQLDLKMDITYMSPWKYLIQAASSYQTKDRSGMANFRTATHQNRALIDLTNRVSTWLMDKAHHSTNRIPLSPEDFATILPQLCECSRLHWKARVPDRAIEIEVKSLVNGEIWGNSKLHNKIHGMITKFHSLAQIYENEMQDSSLRTIVKSIESVFNTIRLDLTYNHRDFLSQAGYGNHYKIAVHLNSQLTWLVTETPLLTLFYSGLFQLYEKNRNIPLIFGFSPLVMSLQCAAKLTGSNLYTEPTSEEPLADTEIPLEASQEISQEITQESFMKNIRGTKPKELPLDQYSGAQLWAKVNRA